MLALLLAIAIPAAAATPPPIIITTKTSELCKTLRTLVAPSVAGLVAQDQMIGQGRELLEDMAKMESEGGGAWAEMDAMRLLNVVDGVAANNIKVHRLLDSLNGVSLKDPTEAAELSTLRSRLLTIAGHQNDALNQLSGAADTKEFSDLQGFKNPMGAALQPDTHITSTPQTLPADPPAGDGVSVPASAAREVVQKQTAANEAESPILALVRPLVDRCR